MKITKTEIEGLLILEPRVFSDDRGYFFESFNAQVFNDYLGKKVDFVQDNESLSKKGVVRGLHFQTPPMAQGKLVRVTQGTALDIAVDIRKDSPTYGQHYSIELTAENKLMFWIPEGFAHGFVALENNTRFLYKCTNFYSPACEAALLWSDKDLNIDWKISEALVSDKDNIATEFVNFTSPF